MKHVSPLISVVIPVCNRFKFLEACLDSVISADLGPELMEIIVVENASTTPTSKEILDRYPTGRIQIIHYDKLLPVAKNWNRSVSAASGRWIHLLHDDDKVLPHFYSGWLGILQKDVDIGMVASPVQFINEFGEFTSVQEEPRLFRDSIGTNEELKAFLSGNPVRCPSVMFKCQSWIDIGKFDEELSFTVDWICWFDLARLKGAYFSSDIRSCYRDSPFSASNNIGADLKWLNEIIASTRRNRREYRKQYGVTVGIFGGSTFANAAYRMVVFHAQRGRKWESLKILLRIMLLPSGIGARLQLVKALLAALLRRAKPNFNRSPRG